MCDLHALLPHPGTTPHDQLLVAALRCHAAGAGCDLLGFFDLALGPHAAPAAARALAGFARALLAVARRTPRLGEPGEPPTHDELAAARLLGALRTGDSQLAIRLLAWIAPPQGRARLLAAAVALHGAVGSSWVAAAAE